MPRSIVQDILKRSDAVMVIEEARTVLEEEARRRQAFHEWLSPSVKAEFIQGEVVIHSPAKRAHLDISGHIYRLLSVFLDIHKAGAVSVEKAMVQLSRNDYEPDVCYWGKEKAATFTQETMMHPAPDLIVEVLSKSTQKNDRGIKMDDYALHGVQEYWIVDPWQKRVEQYGLLSPQDRSYLLFEKYGLSDEITARTLSGFSVPVAAFFDAAENLRVLQTLLRF